MKYMKWFVILALALGACSERSAPPAAATSAKPAPETAAPATAAPAGQAANPQMPNPVLAAAPSPAAPAPAPDMKPKYPDKAALLADIQAVKPTQQVELDGQTVSPGFGPAMRYRTAKDGSISR